MMKHMGPIKFQLLRVALLAYLIPVLTAGMVVLLVRETRREKWI